MKDDEFVIPVNVSGAGAESAVSRAGGRGEAVALVAIALVFAGRVLANWHFVPLWDGRIYADCVLSAVQTGDVAALNCANHPTIGYMAFVALSQWIAFGSYGAMLAVNAALGACMLFAFHTVLHQLDPSGDRAGARVLATAAMSTHPVLLASAVNLTPDFGVAVFFVLVIATLSLRRYFAAAVCGTLLALSKEPGIALYFIAVGANAIVLGSGATVEDRLRPWLRRKIVSAPLVAFAGFLLFRAVGAKTHASGLTLWGGETPLTILAKLLLPTFNHVQRWYPLWIFVAGFQWVGLLIIAAAAVFAVRAGTCRPSRPAALTIAMLGAGAYVLTRYTTFMNPRYFLALAPLLVALTYVAVVRLGRDVGALSLAAMTVLFAAASVSTVDPVMSAAYGTFRFGNHRLLYATSHTGECCGYGRDQLVYNLEFTNFATLQNAVYTDLVPGADTVIASHPDADWFFSGPLDATHRRSLVGGTQFRLMGAQELLTAAPPPDNAYYLALPNFPNGEIVEALQRKYDVTGARSYENGGYEFLVLSLRRRGS